MELIFWWMVIVWLAAFAGYWALRRLLKSRSAQDAPQNVPVAHSSRLTSLIQYRAALKRYRRLLTWSNILLSLGLFSAIILTARPASVSFITPTQQNRDVMLCLDASGSVLREDATVLDRFRTLVATYSTQRFGLTFFNSSAVTVIPLNDDYQLTSQELATDAQAFKAQSGTTFTDLTNATLADFSHGTSLVSDGLASCIEAMGPNPSNRSQSIVLATDNEVEGAAIVSMTQAIALARQRNIRIFAFDPGVSDPNLAADHDQLKIVTKETGGDYFNLSDPSATTTIVHEINAGAPQTFVGLPQLATNDNPLPFLYVAALLAVATVVMLWRLEL